MKKHCLTQTVSKSAIALGGGMGKCVYTNKNYKNKSKISIANFPIKMKLFSQRNKQNPSQKSFSHEGINTCEHVNY